MPSLSTTKRNGSRPLAVNRHPDEEISVTLDLSDWEAQVIEHITWNTKT